MKLQRRQAKKALKKAHESYFILQINSFTGRNTTRDQHEILDEEGWNVQECAALYAVISLGSDSAEIVDDGYRSLAEVQQAWPHALPRQRISTNEPQKTNNHGRNQK